MEAKRPGCITYEFDGFRLDTRQMMLFHHGEEVSLPPRAVETLTALVERRGAIVSRDELFEAIWHDTVVEESNLSRYVHVLRSTLGRHPDGTEYIETFRRRGYRFNGEVIEGLPAIAQTPERPDPHTVPVAAGRDVRVVPEGNVLKVAEWRRQPEPPAAAEPLVHGRRRGHLAAYSLGGIAIVAAVLYFFLGSRQSPPLTDRDIVLIAEFENRTGEQIFDGTLTQGLSIQLQQSPFLGIFPDVAVRETLRLMKRPPESKVTREIAAEICQRKAIKAYIVGTISPVGGNYLITLEAIDGTTGEPIASEQAEAEGRERVIGALSSAAASLRETLGESLASISKRSSPLEVTTASLEALRMYTLAREQLDRSENGQALVFLRRAVGIDPDFAFAYAEQAIPYMRLRQHSLAADAAAKAYSMAGRVSEYERLQITDTYHAAVTYDLDERIRNLTVAKELYPRDARILYRLGNLLIFTAEYEKAIEPLEQARAAGANGAARDLAAALTALGRFDEARSLIESNLADSNEPQRLYRVLADIAVASGDSALLDRSKTFLMANFPAMHTALEAEIAAMEGRYEDSRRFFDEASALAANSGMTERAAVIRTWKMRATALLKRCPDARADFETLKDSLDIRLVPAGCSSSFAICGERVQAENILGVLHRQLPQGTIAQRVVTPTVRGLLLLDSGDPRSALSHLETIPRQLDPRNAFLGVYARAYAYLHAGEPQKAVDEFRSILDRRREMPIDPVYPLAHLGIARARKETGDLDGARRSYEAFLAMWKDADAGLPDLVAARAELKAISAN